MEKELKLMKGNEAFAEAVIRAGADGYFGYPITPQSEVLEYLMSSQPEKRTGMVVLQAESEVAAINMVYGGAGCGKKIVTSSSGPGISLKQEGISYIAGAELPCLMLNVMRGGPGLGTIQPSQSDYFQSVKGGGHGDYNMLVLAPYSVQEMADFVFLGFELAFKYRNPVMLLSDGAIGQMMEKVWLPPQQPRWTAEEIAEKNPWATTGKPASREKNIIKSLNLESADHTALNYKLLKKYNQMKEEAVMFEEVMCDDAEYILIAFGTSARICQKVVELARAKGIKVGLLRPITLFPFPTKAIHALAKKAKGILTVELNNGQMIEDVKLSVNGVTPVEFYGFAGGTIFSPSDVLEALENQLIA